MTQLPKLDAKRALPSLYQAYISELEQSDFSGEIDVTFSGRLIAATDNSVYQQLPQAVLYPVNEAVIQTILKLAAQDEFH